MPGSFPWFSAQTDGFQKRLHVALEKASLRMTKAGDSVCVVFLEQSGEAQVLFLFSYYSVLSVLLKIVIPHDGCLHYVSGSVWDEVALASGKIWALVSFFEVYLYKK